MPKVCFSLYDESGNMLRPWAEAGYECYCVDLQGEPRIERPGKGSLTFLQMDCMGTDLLRMILETRPGFLFGFPPCTDVAVSGALYFEKKFRDNKFSMVEAAKQAYIIKELAEMVDAIWAFENPKSMLKHYLGDPQYKFHPNEFGAYLPEDDVHPRFPNVIPPRDAYLKETWIWASPKFVFPPKAEVYVPPGASPIMVLGGKSERTKQIRSETPRGFAKATFMANRWD